MDTLKDSKELRTPISFYKTLPLVKVVLTFLWEFGKINIQAFFPPKYAKKYGYSNLHKRNYSNTFHYIKRKGFIKNKNSIYYLTPKGEKEAFFAYLNAESSVYINKKPKWDNRWRIVFFDIPEKKRHYRDYLRTILKAVGFKEFQKSIWIYPYPIPKFLKELLWEENIKQYTRFITTQDIEYDRDLKRLFDL